MLWVENSSFKQHFAFDVDGGEQKEYEISNNNNATNGGLAIRLFVIQISMVA